MSEQQSIETKIEIMRQRRDLKSHDHLAQYAPVWIVYEEPILQEDALLFEVVFYHPQYHWVKRRYYFDSYNNVLYHRGQIAFDEEATYALQSEPPYITAPFSNTVNSYGG